MNTIDTIKDLVKTLNEYRDAYYNNNKPIVSDADYDKLYDQLERLEKETGIIFSNSPTQTVGYPVKSGFEKVTHSHPMLSLSKTKDVLEFSTYCGNKPSLVSLKMDGLTVLLTYEDGKLIQAETRGDGQIGELITDNAKAFINIPLTISYKDHLEIEGEAIITIDDFEKINSRLPKSEQFANPRNLASGSVSQLDAAITAKRFVRFIAWKVPYLTKIGDNFNLNNFADRLIYINDLGFDIVPYARMSDFTAYHSYVETINKLKEIADEMHYPYDGFVHTYLDIKYGESLGNTGHHPKHSFVLKEQDEEYETELTDIIWQMGKTGQLTPVAVFNEVDIDGSKVNRASLHNVSILTNLDLQIGDKITVYKSNMIIPQVKRNLSADDRESTYINIPATCPVCGSPTKIQRDNDSDVLICTNPDCRGKLLGKLKHFCSKDAMDIQGLSEATLEKFINLHWIGNISEICEVLENPSHYRRLIGMDGFGVKSVDKLRKAIQDSKHTTLDRFINALSIPNIGKEAAKTIAKYFDYDWIKFGIACNTNFNWQKLDDFGEIMAKSITKFWNDNKDWVTELGSSMDFYNPNATTDNTQNNALKGKTFVITGKLIHFKNRDELVKKIEAYGGKVAGSVSKNTDYLINNDVNSTSGKNKKAKELGVKIITEEQFLSE